MPYKFNPITGDLDFTNASGGSSSNSFTTIQTDSGTSPVASSSTDTLTITSSNNSIGVSGNSTTDQLDVTLKLPLNPRKGWYDWDHWVSNLPTSKMGWRTMNSGTGTGTVIFSPQQGHPGVVRLSAGADNGTGYCTMDLEYNTVWFGDGPIEQEWVFKLENTSNATNGYVLHLGWGDTVNTTEYNDGVYIEYSHSINGGNVVCKASAGAIRTAVNSTFPLVGAQWYKLKVVVNSDSTQADFYMAQDGSAYQLIGTVPTNLPSTAAANYCSPNAKIYKTAGTAYQFLYLDSWLVDWRFATEV